MLALPAAVLGVILRGVFTVISLMRRPRPIHSRGVVLRGTITWLPTARRSGIAWIDETAEPVTAVVRVSRSVGLPTWLPDVIGLAARIDSADGPADLELASTGAGVPGRFTLVPQRSPARGFFGTLLPYRGASGPVLVAARTESPEDLPAELPALVRALESRPWRLSLAFATPTGPWHRFAELTIDGGTTVDDARLRFDAVRRPLPGADSYRWVRLARQPSYRKVQEG